MTELQQVLDKYLDINLCQIILSGAKDKEGPSKVRIRPVIIREKLMFQCTRTVGPKELHENLGKTEALEQTEKWMYADFKQLQLDHSRGTVNVLVSKKGKFTIKEKKKVMIQGSRKEKNEAERMLELSHNRKKRYILEEGKPVPFLQDLGVMTGEGKIVRSRYDKFRQINRFLEFIEDILPRLDKDREVTILDFGCGKSYLTFAMYYYLHELKQYDVRIIGLDLKTDVIEQCNRLSETYGYEKLHFYVGDIASYEGVTQVDMVVTLHACDTATDFALAKAVNWGASVILSVPCCQHELNKQISNEVLAPVFSYGVLKERMAALMTDGLRAQILELAGYETQILEFIDMEHTPKNLLIRGVYTGKKKQNEAQIRTCLDALGLHPTLERLLFEGGIKE
ncbi:MAG: SAM-dependent methyltransferase [Clostridiales bacterium]|nr:SAM-dependent methyltransferase [Clostridiales bacterium]